MDDSRAPYPEYSSLAEQSGISEHVLQFMNSLPMTGEIVEWIEQFREALRVFLGDVDKVTVSINTNCDLIHPEKYKPFIGTSEYPLEGKGRSATNVLQLPMGTVPAKLLIEQLQRLGYSLEEYRPPYAYEYYYAGHAYLGTILLFRNKDEPPVSHGTIAKMECLRPFVTFMLSDLVTRYYYTHPAKMTFLNNLLIHIRELELATDDMKDIEVLVFRLYGFSYEEISRRLDISISIVKRRASRMARKGGADTLMELFSRRFIPWLEEPGDEFWNNVRAAIRERQAAEISRRKAKRMERRNIRRRKER